MLADLMGGARQRALIAVGACLATLALAAPAGAVTIGAPDLEAEPHEDMSVCSQTSESCLVMGEFNAGNPFRAPTQGRITEVRFRTPVAHNAAWVRILKAQGGNQFLAGGRLALGPVPVIPAGLPIHAFETDIPVEQNDVLALELDPADEAPGGHDLLDSFEQPGAFTRIFDPAPALAENVEPDEPAEDLVPAIQYEFEAVTVEQPQEEDEDDDEAGGPGGSIAPPFTLPPTADVEVTKTFLRGKRFPRVGETANFLVVVRNNGPNTAQGVVLRDNFGRGLAFDEAKVLKGSSGKARCGGGVGRRAGALVCAIGALAPGARVGIELSFGVTGKPSKGAGKGERRRERNRARVSSTAPRDPDPANNKDQAVARIGEGGAICPPRSLTGTRRNDRLRGSARNETILALSGNDRANAKRGRDCVFGGEGRDVLIGGPQSDYIDGGAGNDLILAADGSRDTIVCAGGKRDRVVADRIDRVARSCERVRRR